MNWAPDEEREEYVKRLARADMKEAMKEAIKEWLDDKFATFGKWTLRGILAAIMVGGLYAFLAAHGWKVPPP